MISISPLTINFVSKKYFQAWLVNFIKFDALRGSLLALLLSFFERNIVSTGVEKSFFTTQEVQLTNHTIHFCKNLSVL